MTKLTAVTIRTGRRCHTWFLHLPMVEGRAHLPGDVLEGMLRDMGVPHGATITIA